MLSFCSPFYHDLAYFGGYPTKDHFQQLVENDFTYFIDLTTLRERQRLEYDYSLDIPHHKNLFYINFSIVDNNIPYSPRLYIEFLDFLSKIFQTKEKIYIHCKGGHGRSSLLVASILCYLFLYQPVEAFTKTKQYHDSRPNLKTKYKGISCPQLYSQRKFIIDLYQSMSKNI